MVKIPIGCWWRHGAQIRTFRCTIVYVNIVRLLTLIFALGVLSCSPVSEKKKPFKLEPVNFKSLPGWGEDNYSAALRAFRGSCKKLTVGNNGSGSELSGLKPFSWHEACLSLPNGDVDDDEAQNYFEKWFQPYLVFGPEGSEGLFTGYFEAELTGSLRRESSSQTPIYGVPDDHITVDLGLFDPQLAGKKLVGMPKKKQLIPYHTRHDIAMGALKGKAERIAWADDLIDLYILHVQGSGRLRLRDGSVMRVGFAGHNGHDYRSIGKVLIERSQLRRNHASWPHIRQWIEENQDQARSLLAENARFIFFRTTDIDGPIGAQGVPLTAGRSMAVDKRYIPLGAPLWIVTHWPNDKSRPLRQLLVAQDTGAAIRGPVRGDYFWGFGKKALRLAGTMKSAGRYFVLLPR